jgi:hypothetical protein
MSSLDPDVSSRDEASVRQGTASRSDEISVGKDEEGGSAVEEARGAVEGAREESKGVAGEGAEKTRGDVGETKGAIEREVTERFEIDLSPDERSDPIKQSATCVFCHPRPHPTDPTKNPRPVYEDDLVQVIVDVFQQGSVPRVNFGPPGQVHAVHWLCLPKQHVIGPWGMYRVTYGDRYWKGDRRVRDRMTAAELIIGHFLPGMSVHWNSGDLSTQEHYHEHVWATKSFLVEEEILIGFLRYYLPLAFEKREREEGNDTSRSDRREREGQAPRGFVTCTEPMQREQDGAKRGERIRAKRGSTEGRGDTSHDRREGRGHERDESPHPTSMEEMRAEVADEKRESLIAFVDYAWRRIESEDGEIKSRLLRAVEVTLRHLSEARSSL